MDGSCPFCLKIFPKIRSEKENFNFQNGWESGTASELQSRFFLLLKRHLSEDNIQLDKFKLSCNLNDILNRNEKIKCDLLPCPDCFSLLKSFCDWYNEIKILEMKMNGRLLALMKITKCSRTCRFRNKCFKSKLKKANGDLDLREFIKGVEDFREDFVNKCFLKAERTYPRVRINSEDPKSKVIVTNQIPKKKSYLSPRTSSHPCRPSHVLVMEVESEDIMPRATENANMKVLAETGIQRKGDRDVTSENGSLVSDVKPVVAELNTGVDIKKESPNLIKVIPNRTTEETTKRMKLEAHWIVDAEENEQNDIAMCGDLETRSVHASDNTPGQEVYSCPLPTELSVFVDEKVSNLCQKECRSAEIPNEEIESKGHLEIKNNVPVIEASFSLLSPSASVNDGDNYIHDDQEMESNESDLPTLEPPMSLASQNNLCSNSSITTGENSEHSTNSNNKILPKDKEKVCSTSPVTSPEVGDGGASENLNLKMTENPNNSYSIGSSTRRRSARAKHSCPKCSKTFASIPSLKFHEDLNSCQIEIEDTNLNLEENKSPYEINSNEDASVSDYSEDIKIQLKSDRDLIQNPPTKPASAVPLEMKNIKLKKVVNKKVSNVLLDKNCRALLNQDLQKIERAMEEAPHSCKEVKCGEIFCTSEDLEKHSKLHGTFKCLFCDQVKTYAPDLSLHEITTHGSIKYENFSNSRFTCVQCGISTIGRGNYIHHHLIHLNIEPVASISCSFCKFVFDLNNYTAANKKKYITHHYKAFHGTVKGSPLFHCDEEGCSAYFRGSYQIRNHKIDVHYQTPALNDINIHETDERKGYKCPDCSQRFKFSQYLDRHRQRRHPSNLPYCCTVEGCSRRFETKGSFENHLKRHEQSPSLKCSKCGFLCRNKGGLKSHLKTHEENRIPRRNTRPADPNQTFICSDCGKSFKKKVQWKSHLLSHLGPEGWQYTCETCGKKCMSIKKLQEHQNTHRKEDKIVFTCEHCGLKYAHRHNFRHHLKNKHGIILEVSKKTKESVKG